ncbi:hypothetical protein TPE_0198 [Treponema pedis str. T A4]|uniref:Uncharacterized protein n=1 Tax=Treponema pedis str. T A4 TaxID=1291379 RepID=S6A7U5_9SPIR|nr:hypothetical protein TPE_0198 [Treponema pedis str. T A4]
MGTQNAVKKAMFAVKMKYSDKNYWSDGNTVEQIYEILYKLF